MRHRFGGLLAAVLLGLMGPVLSEPVPERDVPAVDEDAVGVWGDPEDSEQRDAGWTWFGMGYERRAGAAGAGAPHDGHDNVQAPGGGAGGAGK